MTKEIKIQSAYGDGLFKNPKLAQSAYLMQVGQTGGVSMVRLNDGSYLVTTRKRAAQFETQGAGEILFLHQVVEL